MARKIAFTVHGRVQGVCFRDFTQKQAKQLKLSGWVSNADSGEVVGEAIGDEAAIDAFHDALKTGPPAAKVEAVELTLDEATTASGSSGFSVR